ncbi:CHAT domain-containing protein [Nonomuraea sp. NPDC049649]|uniref:CHAT domain-containing protein n=1 Tax=Nonomuraea sp. NPDC049649 TaxID=3155776 RepID=UPI00341ADDE7
MATPELIRTLERSPGSPLLVRAAEMAVQRSIIDPAQALRAGRTVLAAAEKAGDGEAASVALRAMALASRELGDLQDAEQRLWQAIQTPGAPAKRIAQARLSLVTVRTERGHPLQALRLATLAWAHLSPLDRAKLDTQRAVALAHLGRYQEAIASCDRAVRALVAAPGTVDDRRFLAGGLLNRGLVHAYRGGWDQAMRDITACLRIARQAGLSHLVRLAAANLPFLAVRRGDIGAAFTHYRQAEDNLFEYPERLATMRADFAGALLAAHLPGEARALLHLAVPDLEKSGARVALAEARLKLAQVELLTGDAREAVAVAERAMHDLSAQDRQSWLPLAREVVLRARLALTPPTPALLVDLAACADDLERNVAQVSEGAALRLTAAETALALGDKDTAAAHLSRLTARPPQAFPPRELRTPPTQTEDAAATPVPLDGHHTPPAHTGDGTATPLSPDEHHTLHASPAYTGDATGAPVPLLVRQHALALEAELEGDVSAAFGAVRDGLAGVGSQVDGLDDPALRAHVARAGARLAAFGLGLAVRGGCAEEVFEWAERWRAVTAPVHGRSCDGVRVADVRAVLGRAALVEYVSDDSSLFAVVVTGGRAVLRSLGALRPVHEGLIRLRYSLRRSVLYDGAAGAESVTAAGTDLERLLLAPLAADLGDGPLVVVPTGILHTLPWAALPCMRGRPVTVVASAQSWLSTPFGPVTAHQARTLTPSRPRVSPKDGPGLRVAAAAGPGLRHAAEEVERVVACHAGARPVAARREEVLEALTSCDVVHLAAHGVFHARSPLLSSITLEDGPLMAYDLLGRSPMARLVVLSACDSGMARTPTDGAPLGLAGTFLAEGAACVIAGMVPVADEDALTVMSRFHELLATGQTPASALALASAQTGITVFTCFGAGDRPLVPDSGRSADTQPRTRQGHSQQPMSQPRRVPCRGQPVATGLDESVTHSDQEPT